MKRNAHTFMGLGLGCLFLSILNIFVSISLLFFIMIPVFFEAGLLNDILDYKVFAKHKRYFLTHSPISPLIFFMAIVFGIPGVFFGPAIFFFLIVICLSIFETHILMDALNPSGVPFPIKKKSIRKIPYDSAKWNSFFICTGFLLTISGFLFFIINSIVHS